MAVEAAFCQLTDEERSALDHRQETQVDNPPPPPPHIPPEVIQANDVNRGCTSERSYLACVQAFVLSARPSAFVLSLTQRAGVATYDVYNGCILCPYDTYARIIIGTFPRKVCFI